MRSRLPLAPSPSSATRQPGSHQHLRVLIAINDAAAADAVFAKMRQINPTWTFDRVSFAEGVVVAHPTYDIVVMGEHFASGMMSCSTAIELVRRNERFRQVRQQRLLVLASFLPNAVALGADVAWDHSVGVDAMHTDLHGALDNRV